mmetsp:Transcript_37365/g.119872  ORF Transcript_37365/g.119872 Transcript_37365/m.119872 type:complete len:211 (-) Transcript_37365:4198-4830(-)
MGPPQERRAQRPDGVGVGFLLLRQDEGGIPRRLVQGVLSLPTLKHAPSERLDAVVVDFLLLVSVDFFSFDDDFVGRLGVGYLVCAGRRHRVVHLLLVDERQSKAAHNEGGCQKVGGVDVRQASLVLEETCEAVEPVVDVEAVLRGACLDGAADVHVAWTSVVLACDVLLVEHRLESRLDIHVAQTVEGVVTGEVLSSYFSHEALVVASLP